MSEPTLKVVRTVWRVMITPKAEGKIGWGPKDGPKWGTRSIGEFGTKSEAEEFVRGIEFGLQWAPEPHRPEYTIVTVLVEDTSKKITDFI